MLVAETDHLIHYALSKTLQSYDVEMKSVYNGKEALSEISSCFYPLCIFDSSTPDMNNGHLLKTIKENSPDTQIIMIMEPAYSDSDATNITKERVDESLYYCLTKPFEISELKAMVQRALNKDEKPFPFQRREPRRCVREPVSYTVTVVELGRPVSLTLNGHVVDICEKGMGLRTYYPLEPGHLLMLNHGMEEKTGVVRWSAALDETCTYRVGVEFLDK